MLFTRRWWIDSLQRAGRTAILMVIPFTVSLARGEILAPALAAAFGFITSLATSLRGLPETVGRVVPWWEATLTRMAKSGAQGLITGIGTSTVLTDVDWTVTLDLIASGLVGSLLLSLLSSLPETSPLPDDAVVEEYDDDDLPEDDDLPDDEDGEFEEEIIPDDDISDSAIRYETRTNDTTSGYLQAPSRSWDIPQG